MADVVITAANVKTSSASATLKKQGISASAFLAGQPLYLNGSNKLAPCGNNGVTPVDTLKGVALCSCPGPDQPCYYADVDADFTPGFPTTVGETYVVSSTVGAICPIADLGTLDTVNYVGVGKAANKLQLNCNATGITKP